MKREKGGKNVLGVREGQEREAKERTRKKSLVWGLEEEKEEEEEETNWK